MAEVVVRDTPEYTLYRDAGPGWVSERVEWKPGSAAYNEQQIRDKARQALASNASFLALATPTNAQTVAQVRALTRQTNALLRLYLDALNDVSDT